MKSLGGMIQLSGEKMNQITNEFMQPNAAEIHKLKVWELSHGDSLYKRVNKIQNKLDGVVLHSLLWSTETIVHLIWFREIPKVF